MKFLVEDLKKGCYYAIFDKYDNFFIIHIKKSIFDSKIGIIVPETGKSNIHFQCYEEIFVLEKINRYKKNETIKKIKEKYPEYFL